MDKAIGVDIGGTKMLMLAEYKGEKLTKILPTGMTCTSTDIKKELSAFVAMLPFTPSCIGVAVPGLVEEERVVVASDVLPAIAGMTTDFLCMGDYPIYLINDVKAALIQESAAVDEHATTAVLMVGTGIAIGVKANGKILTGCKGWAGELGSIPIPTLDGIRTLDTVASGAGILAQAGVSAARLRQQIEQGDEASRQLIHTAGEYLGLGMATVIHLFNPERFILGGGTLQYEGYEEAAVRTAQKYTLPQLWEVCSVERSKNPAHMVAQGARRFASR
ncbi:ROK family protein [Aneurinibacillus sp. REN35]|uniref:ROK family protein n=1 Tax=Aneurinibacillus sp. REN35 TaxID=3237286 RepID=UPI0035283456